MISVIIPTLQAEEQIAEVLVAFMPAILSGLVTEVIVSDGGSTDKTFEICDEMGASFYQGLAGRGAQMIRGAKKSSTPWLLFLHADTILEKGWEQEVGVFVAQGVADKDDRGRHCGQPSSCGGAAYFSFALRDKGVLPFLVAKGVDIRCHLFGLPYGDQGLLISRKFYDKLGGFSALPIMEDVDLIRRIGRKNLTALESKAYTGAGRYQSNGYIRRVGRNVLCMLFYFMGIAPQTISRFYEKGRRK